jgi:hypothetical protein
MYFFSLRETWYRFWSPVIDKSAVRLFSQDGLVCTFFSSLSRSRPGRQYVSPELWRSTPPVISIYVGFLCTFSYKQRWALSIEFRYSDCYQTKWQLSEYIYRTSTVELATLDCQLYDSYRITEIVSDKKWGILTLFVYFFTNFRRLKEYWISDWRIQETIRLSNIGSRPQSTWLSDIGLRKNYRLPTSGNKATPAPDQAKLCGPSGQAAWTGHHVQNHSLLLGHSPPASQVGCRVGPAF